VVGVVVEGGVQEAAAAVAGEADAVMVQEAAGEVVEGAEGVVPEGEGGGVGPGGEAVMYNFSPGFGRTQSC
jgi:hypothetical protein